MSDNRVTILNWLTQLKHLTRPTAEPVTRDKMAAYVALLSDRFPTHAFTMRSLQAMTDGAEFFPAYDVLQTALSTWLYANTPKTQKAIADERAAEAGAAMHQAVQMLAEIQRRYKARENVAALTVEDIMRARRAVWAIGPSAWHRWTDRLRFGDDEWPLQVVFDPENVRAIIPATWQDDDGRPPRPEENVETWQQRVDP